MNISVVIPLLNEKESLKELCDSISEVMSTYGFSYEIILESNSNLTTSAWFVSPEHTS